MKTVKFVNLINGIEAVTLSTYNDNNLEFYVSKLKSDFTN